MCTSLHQICTDFCYWFYHFHYLVHIRANFCAHFSSFNYYFSFLHLKNQLKCLSWIQAIIKHWPNSTTNLLKKYFCFMKKNWKYFYSSMHSIYVKETTGCWLNYQPYKAHFSCDLQFITEFPLCYFGSELIWISKETIPCNIWTKHPFWVVNEKIFFSSLRNVAYNEWHVGTRVWVLRVPQFIYLFLDILN